MFPVEVIDRILSEVNIHHPSISKTTFEACSRVCSSWRQISQIHLFSHFTIQRRSNERDEVQLKFVKCVAQGDKDATRLAQYIRFVYLVDERWSTISANSERCSARLKVYVFPLFQRGGPPNKELLLIEDSVISFLDQLQIVRGLSLCLETSWDDIGLAGNKAFLRLFRLNSVKAIHLNIKGGVPISLLPLLGENIRGVSIGENIRGVSIGENIRGVSIGERGLTLEKPQLAPESVLDSNESQTRCRPGPVHFNMPRSEDLGVFMSPLFKDVNPNYFASLRSVSIVELTSEIVPSWEASDIPRFRMLLESCAYISKIKFGRCGTSGGYPFGLEIELIQDHAPSTQNLNDSQHPGYHVIQSLWSGPRECEAYSGLAQELLQLTLPASLVPQPSPTFPTVRTSPNLAPATHRISDVITSFTLNYYLRPGLEGYSGTDYIPQFNDVWTSTDKFLSERCKKLQRLSVNIDISWYFNKKRPFSFPQPDTLNSEAEASFLRMRTRLEDANEGKSGFEKNLKVDDPWEIRSVPHFIALPH